MPDNEEDPSTPSRPGRQQGMREKTTRGLPDRPPPEPIGRLPLRLKPISGPGRGGELVMRSGSSVLRIGREPDNDLVLPDETASRYHAEVHRSAGGYLLKDLGSTNGTLLDGVRIREVFLPSYCSVRVGLTDIRVVAGDEDRASAADALAEIPGLWGRCEKMLDVFRLVRKIAPSNLTTLITGETGTGKEIVARAIHQLSPRSSAPFVVFDCGATPKDLMENELFGHQKGAFTGATALKKGVFEEADGGAAFLDEIGELTLQQQPKLLRVLERHEVRRLGAAQPVKVDVRVLAATNRYLPEETRAGRFREDLFYRISVIQLHLPPLRERREDVPLLVDRFLREVAPQKHFDDAAVELLSRYQWPGNVRELRHTVERTALLNQSDLIRAGDIIGLTDGRPACGIDSDGSLESIEKSAILRALDSSGGNKTLAAKKLGIAYSTLYEKLKKYEVNE